MRCDFCNKNEADVQLIKVVDDRVESINICNECLENLEFLSDEDFMSDLARILSKIFEIDIKFKSKKSGKQVFENIKISKDKRCIHCNTNIDSIKRMGRVGCEKCYQEFRDELTPIIKAIHKSDDHTGQIPSNACDSIKIEGEIKHLKTRLDDEVLIENFEEAAKIRDNIKKLKKKLYIKER